LIGKVPRSHATWTDAPAPDKLKEVAGNLRKVIRETLNNYPS